MIISQNLLEDCMRRIKKNVSGKRSKRTQTTKRSFERTFDLISLNRPKNLLRLLQPGSFVRLENHPNDLPPFQLISCKGGKCLVRQQTWGNYVHWEVEHHRLKSA